MPTYFGYPAAPPPPPQADARTIEELYRATEISILAAIDATRATLWLTAASVILAIIFNFHSQ